MSTIVDYLGSVYGYKPANERTNADTQEHTRSRRFLDELVTRFDYDPDWSERIELAKQAREDGRKMRAGKPPVFTY